MSGAAGLFLTDAERARWVAVARFIASEGGEPGDYNVAEWESATAAVEEATGHPWHAVMGWPGDGTDPTA